MVSWLSLAVEDGSATVSAGQHKKINFFFKNHSSLEFSLTVCFHLAAIFFFLLFFDISEPGEASGMPGCTHGTVCNSLALWHWVNGSGRGIRTPLWRMNILSARAAGSHSTFYRGASLSEILNSIHPSILYLTRFVPYGATRVTHTITPKAHSTIDLESGKKSHT